jgi:hypothetical protein
MFRPSAVAFLPVVSCFIHQFSDEFAPPHQRCLRATLRRAYPELGCIGTVADFGSVPSLTAACVKVFGRRPSPTFQRDRCPLTPFATLGRRTYPRHPYLPKGAKGPGNDAKPSCGSPGFSEQEDQFQRNGVLLGQRFVVRIGDASAVSRGGAAALLASLKSLQQPRQGASGEKGDPFAVPTSPLAPLLPRSTSPPSRPKGPNGPESDGQPRVRH